MADGPAPDPDGPVSLYRRFRPGKFSELRGQPHVVQALRGAVATGTVGHAYLFSGPRGTGKTSTARILARALNCSNPQDGEPCGKCPSCVDIVKGVSLDVHELDAASNNGVEAMRELVSHAALATPGRSKVYIVDEVHMLSNAAANSLLKTLEEPPRHVVFVLATTDPQKVPATIRSRTQHFEFRLFGADTLDQLLRDVRDQAGLDLDDQAVAVAVRRGHGSARDALSALDQVAAAGAAELAGPDLTAVGDALRSGDVGGLLVGAASLHEVGWGPQQLATELVDELRQAFLVNLAPSLAEVAGADRERLAEMAQDLGLARLVRSMEVLGRAQVEMREAPDPRVVLEIALLRLVRPELDDTTDAILDRLARLERGGVGGGAPGGAPGSVSTAGAAGAPASAAPTPRRPIRRSGSSRPPTEVAAPAGSTTPTAPAPTVSPPTVPPPSATPTAPAPIAPAIAGSPEAAAPPAASPTPAPASTSAAVDRDTLVEVWGDDVLRNLPGLARALYSAGRFVSVADGVATFALPTPPHRDRCDEFRKVVEDALSARVGAQVRLHLVTEGEPSAALSDGAAAPKATHRPAAAAAPSTAAAGDTAAAGAATPSTSAEGDDALDDEDFDPADLEGAEAVESVAESRILEAFPGATEVRE